MIISILLVASINVLTKAEDQTGKVILGNSREGEIAIFNLYDWDLQQTIGVRGSNEATLESVKYFVVNTINIFVL